MACCNNDTDSDCGFYDGCNTEVLCGIGVRCGSHHIDSNDDNDTNDNLSTDLNDNIDCDVGRTVNDNDDALDGCNLVSDITDVDSGIDGRDVADGVNNSGLDTDDVCAIPSNSNDVNAESGPIGPCDDDNFGVKAGNDELDVKAGDKECEDVRGNMDPMVDVN